MEIYFIIALWATSAFAKIVPLANKTLGMYVLLADDDHKPWVSDYDWQPKLHPYQQEGTNLLYFTFINPDDMPKVPPAFSALAKTRGSGKEGSVPANTTILFAIGGEVYSNHPNPWKFLESREAAEEMATEVAKWPQMYGCDGIDMDIETGAGNAKKAVINIVYFASKLRELNPDFIFTQPVFGSPSSVAAANSVLDGSYNASWKGSTTKYSLGSVQRVGIMIYSGDDSLNWIKYYVDGCKSCTGYYCPLAACVPKPDIVLGAAGAANPTIAGKLAQDVLSNGLGGIMVWYASVLDASTNETGLAYGASGDASNPLYVGNQPGWKAALNALKQ